ncbi:MAG: ShlB/FhaC/HecB family hemolysin secretion/activation protein [Planctomycetota bacterium]|nr:ShlB/FhaC/HecB family hemolysin secretion/activation protein [Planctomycetota bacterium]
MGHTCRGIGSGRAESRVWSQSSRVIALVAGLAIVGLTPGEAWSQQSIPPPPQTPDLPPLPERPEPPADGQVAEAGEGARFIVSRFLVQYPNPHPQLPSEEDLLDVRVKLSKDAEGFVAPRPGLETVTIRLGDDFGEAGTSFSERALVAVTEAVRDALRQRGLIALFVVVHPDDVGREPVEDKRGDRKEMRLQAWTGTVSEVRTIARGDRLARKNKEMGERTIAEPINHPKHERIRTASPAQQGDLLRGDDLENYVYRRSRHPGRSVDIAIAPADEQPGSLTLDYVVNEMKPWTIYLQASNTGTENTGEWRQRVGLIHNQLTGNDDILRLDFVTASLDDSNSFTGSYDFPLFTDRLRLRTFGAYNEFTATDLGFQGQSSIEGDGAKLGAELNWNFFQAKRWFFDAFAGARWEKVAIRDGNSPAVTPEGDETFFIPTAGIRAERDSEVWSLRGQAAFEWNLPDLGGTSSDVGDPVEIDFLRRTGVQDDWTLLRYDAEFSFFLEPFLNRRAWRGEANAPAGLRSLAHELAFSVRGQESLDNRLIPTEQAVLGGAYSVRGYREAAIAGDNSVFFSAEYRFHLPRALRPNPQPGKLFGRDFRWRPAQEYGRPDWDLILKAFWDYGRTTNSDPVSFERDEHINGAGVGAELQIKQNIVIRADWGVALDDIKGGDRPVKEGSNRFHLTFTVLF